VFSSVLRYSSIVEASIMFKIPTESSLPLSQSVSSRPTLPQGEGEKIGLILSALFWGAEQHIILDAALQKHRRNFFVLLEITKER
jgi:hypothetical protein